MCHRLRDPRMLRFDTSPPVQSVPQALRVFSAKFVQFQTALRSSFSRSCQRRERHTANPSVKYANDIGLYVVKLA